jgi:hypothetical protein
METKKLSIDLSKPEKKPKKEKIKEIVPKIPKKRVVTGTDKWINSIEPEEQIRFIEQILGENIVDKKQCELILQQIAQKIGGYKSQDTHKNLFSESEFITFIQVLELMKKCGNTCFYCKKTVSVLYENVREPMQWTLERIDNDFGHNYGNVEIACLNCNLHRRTMYHERYLFTKELNIIKKSE